MIIVLAGNYYQFENYVHSQLKEGKSRKDFVNGLNERSVRGVTASKIVKVGSFYQHPDAEHLEQLASLTLVRSN